MQLNRNSLVYLSWKNLALSSYTLYLAARRLNKPIGCYKRALYCLPTYEIFPACREFEKIASLSQKSQHEALQYFETKVSDVGSEKTDLSKLPRSSVQNTSTFLVDLPLKSRFLFLLTLYFVSSFYCIGEKPYITTLR